MNKFVQRLLSGALAGVLMAGMCLTGSMAAGDFKYPNSYWPVHTEWESAVGAKDLDKIIDVAQRTYDILDPLGLGPEVCENMEPKSRIASWACELKGDLDSAVKWAERERTYATWLTNSGLGYDYRDLLQSLEARLDYLRAAQTVTVYARAGGSAGTWYGTPVNSSRSDTNAALFYLTFNDSYSLEYWVNYYSSSENFRKASNGGVIELAWNFNPESTAGSQAVLSADSYIAENLKTMGSLNATILLRVGAEMNNWADSDPEVFKQAFRKVASAARAYSNIQMVFSPNDISNRNVSYADYYPGDEYVDWVGMSTYHNTQYISYDKSQGTASYSYDYNKYYDDAFYGVGIYDHDPLVTIKPIVDLAKEHNKPVMISECGFAYQSNAGEDLTAYASAQLNWFYSYINMVYPEVKAVFYFDTSSAATAYSYTFSGSPTLNSTYETAIRENGAYVTDVKGSATGWTTLDKAALGGKGTVRLATYATFPGQHSTTVKYILDGQEVHSTSQAPFYYDLNLDSLSGGEHTLKVEASGGQFNVASQTYTINGSGAPSTPSTPSAPATNAVLSPQKLTVDGKAVECEKYNINGSNYFKLRDLAYVLNGTGSQFGVDFDGATATVTITTGEAYATVGGELATGVDNSATAQPSSQAILINGEKHDELTVYNIGGSNFFQLRELGNVLGFEVGFDADTNTAIVRSK